MFKKPFSFYGRIRRTEYGISVIIYLIAYYSIEYAVESDESLAIVGIAFFPLLWFAFAQGAKRCHDLAKSGWFQLIPFYGLWMLFEDGDFRDNEYGPNPKNKQPFIDTDDTIDGNIMSK